MIDELTPQDEFWLAMCHAMSAVETTAQEVQRNAYSMKPADVLAFAEGLELLAARTRTALQNVMAADWRQYEMALETRH